MKKSKLNLFDNEIRKIQAQHMGEIDGRLIDYFHTSGFGLPLIWEDKPISEEIKKKVIMAGFHNLY